MIEGRRKRTLGDLLILAAFAAAFVFYLIWEDKT